MKYKITLFVSKFMKVGEEYMTVEVPTEFVMEWDTIMDFICCLVDGSDKPMKFEIKKIEEE